MKLSVLIAVSLLAACRSIEPTSPGGAIAIYASEADAIAVASGQFGAVPAGIAGEKDVTLVTGEHCGQSVAAVRHRPGKRGWVIVASLPRSLCEPAAIPRPGRPATLQDGVRTSPGPVPVGAQA